MFVAMRQNAGQPASLQRRRFTLCFFVAGSLHAASLFWHSEQHAPVAGAAVMAAADLVSVAVEPPAPPPPPTGAAPGGGSPVPDAQSVERAAPEQPSEIVKKAPLVARAEVREDRPEVSDTPPERADDDPPSAAPDFLTSDPTDPALSVRPRAARTLLIAARNPPSATAPEVAQQRGATSRYQGYGPGSNGGPGGPGRGFGNGVVTKHFAFGGPTGAFRADVCAIPKDTSSVREVKNCRTLATFFTDSLNVSPRKFTQGFPGVTERTEWFAIHYRGKFHVSVGDYYKFRLLSDDGAILYVDGHQIVDNDGQHAPESRQMTIQLEAGEHELFVSYYQGPRENIALQLFVQASTGPEKLLGPKL